MIVQVVHAVEIGFVGLNVHGMRFFPPRQERGLQSSFDPARDGLRQIVFQGQNIPGVAFERLRPQVAVVGGGNQPGVDSHPFPGTRHGSLHHGVDAKLLPDLYQRLVIFSVMICRRAGNHFDGAELGKVRCHRIGQAFGKIILAGVAG